MDIPEPIEEGAVKFRWIQSTTKPDKVKSIIELDFGKTDMTPSQAANVQRSIVCICRTAFGVSLSRFV